jgi:hypothetical protein
VHFDPVTSEHSPAIQNPELVDAIIEDRRDDDVEAPAREGLPPAFRMRHARHYVEQVMGDAPIRTIREIALQDIDETDAEEADLQALETSIRAIGVLEPLLVRPQGRRFRVIAGAKRLCAARAAGLRTVPCLVQDVDEEMATRIREAVSLKTTALSPAGGEAVGAAQLAAGEGSGRDVDFVAALSTALHAAGADPLRRSVLADLGASELARARCVAALADLPAEASALERAPFNIGEVLTGAVAAILPEARLRGVRLDVTGPATEFWISADRRLVSTAVTALLHGALALSQGPGSPIRVRMHGTTIRPALIFEVVLDEAELDPSTARRLFDGNLKPHPCGPVGACLLGGTRRVARLHGGRADAQPEPTGGWTLTFVVPRPLHDQ